MKIHSVICRLDFAKVHTGIIDRPGTIVEILYGKDPEYWQSYEDNVANRSITAVFTAEDNSLYRLFSVAPTTINFSLQSAAGFDARDLEEDPHINALFEFAHIFCEEFKVNQLARAGLRTSALSNTGSDIWPQFNRLYSKSIVEAVTENVGSPADFAIAMDGTHADGLSYKCRFGPYKDSEAQRFFPKTFAAHTPQVANLFYDIDIFELNFALTVRPKQWAKRPIQRAEAFVRALTSAISAELAS